MSALEPEECYTSSDQRQTLDTLLTFLEYPQRRHLVLVPPADGAAELVLLLGQALPQTPLHGPGHQTLQHQPHLQQLWSGAGGSQQQHLRVKVVEEWLRAVNLGDLGGGVPPAVHLRLHTHRHPASCSCDPDQVRCSASKRSIRIS